MKRHGFKLLCGFVIAFLFFFVMANFVQIRAQGLKVVTTFSILEDFAQRVGGDKVQVSSLVPRGVDPHAWEPSPQEAKLVAEAQLVLANGGSFDAWLINLVKNAAKPGTPLVFVSEGLPALEHDHGGDPHFWLNVQHAIFYVEVIVDALTRLAPEHATYFLERSGAYIRELEELDQRMVALIGTIPKENRVIVTYHNAFSYLAERYDFEVVEFLVVNPEAEPSPRDLGRLVQLLKKQKKPVLFGEPQLGSGTRYVQTLAREVGGAKIYVLYSDSLTGEITSYIEMMDYNVNTLVEALQ